MLYLVENFLYPFLGYGRKNIKSVKHTFLLYLYSDILMEISVISC